MSLSAGSQFGPYRLIAHIGAGGMGEVYRAKDTRLDRDVALKILPDLFSSDAKRLARFEREAKALASLNHPHIAQIYGLQDSDGVHALVLELVEGQDLAERIARGPIPVDEAIAMARQVAEALEYANDRGVIHRDLKPANIKVTPDGVVKVLDFGLAKFTDDVPHGLSHSLSGSGEHAPHPPTLSVSSVGMIFGTAGYIAPEQARGQVADKRVDIWAFGCVLYEMLTGKRIFDGDSITDVLVSVIQKTPDWTLLPANVPPGVRSLLVRCLQKDAKLRLRDIGEARIALALQSGGASLLGLQLSGDPSPHKSQAGGSGRLALGMRLLPWALVIVCAIVTVARRPAAVVSAPVAFGVVLPSEYFLPHDTSPILDLSLDGQTLVFAAESRSHRMLFRRRLSEVTVQPIAGTEGAAHPFLSPDGQWVGFFANNELKKVPIDGGRATKLVSVSMYRGVAWGANGWIVYTTSYTSGLFRVRETGGMPEPLTTVDSHANERTHRWPTFVPGGPWVLFSVGKVDSPTSYDDASIAAVNVETRERRTVFEGASMVRFASPHQLLMLRGNSLLTMQFDVDRLKPLSAPRSLHEEVGNATISGAGYFAASTNGTLAWVPQEAIQDENELVLRSPNGQERVLPVKPQSYTQPRFSPDGTRLVFGIGNGFGPDENLWIYDIAHDRLSRFTFTPGSISPSWSPDGRWIAFGRSASPFGIFKRAADGTSEDIPLWLGPSTSVVYPGNWLSDGSAITVTSLAGLVNTFLVPSQGGSLADMHLGSKGIWGAAVSPDGHYVVHSVAEASAFGIFVQSWPVGHGKWQASYDGGAVPLWSRDGRRLIYVKGDAVMAADVSTREVFQLEPPHELFRGPYFLETSSRRNYDLGPDGTFVLLRRNMGGIAPRQLEIEVGALHSK